MKIDTTTFIMWNYDDNMKRMATLEALEKTIDETEQAFNDLFKDMYNVSTMVKDAGELEEIGYMQDMVKDFLGRIERFRQENGLW